MGVFLSQGLRFECNYDCTPFTRGLILKHLKGMEVVGVQVSFLYHALVVRDAQGLQVVVLYSVSLMFNKSLTLATCCGLVL